MKKRFIEVTSAYSGSIGKILTLSVDGIGGISVDNKNEKIFTRLMHITHNNGGYEVSETPDQILKLIKESKPI